MAVGVVNTGVGAMLGFVNAGGVDAEERIWEPTVAEGGWIGEE